MLARPDLKFRELGLGFQLACCGGAVQLVSLAFHYYSYKGQAIGAWSGVPHTAHIVILSGAMALSLTALVAWHRSLFSGPRLALIFIVLGLASAAQITYRMMAAPFDAIVPANAMIIGQHCMYYCWPSQAKAAAPLTGMWLALIGSIVVLVSGLVLRLDQRVKTIERNFWLSDHQPGRSPWLALMALLASGQFVFGFTFFAFYTVVRNGEPIRWSGWLSMPHTGALVLCVVAFVFAMAWLVAREQAPLRARSTGMLIAAFGTASACWIALRIVRPPFSSGSVDIGPAAYLSLMCGMLLVGTALVYARRE